MLTTLCQIIRRSRETHLLEKFRETSRSLNQALIDEVEEAWRTYFTSQLTKALEAADQPVAGEEVASWEKLSQKMQDASWKQDCAKRDEKFDMHMKALVSSLAPESRSVLDHLAQEKSRAALSSSRLVLKEGNSSSDEAAKLIDASQDILAKVLDKKVRSSNCVGCFLLTFGICSVRKRAHGPCLIEIVGPILGGRVLQRYGAITSPSARHPYSCDGICA